MNISIKDAAKVLCMTERAVRYRCQNGEYVFTYYVGTGGKSGLHIMIDLSSLPPEAQKRYYELHDSPAPTELSCDELLSKYSGKQRRDADFKISVVRQYRRDKRNNDGKLSVRAFLEDFNQHSEMQVTENQMYSWIRLYNKGGLEALMDKRGGHNRGQSLITEEQWELFKSLYLTQQKRSVSRCHQIVKKTYPDTPSVSLFERKVRNIPEHDKIYYRSGDTAFRDSMPHMERDKSGMRSNEQWDSDHHLIDVFVRGRNGKPVQLWFTSFVDVKSTKIMSWLAYEGSPCSSTIKSCLINGIGKFGIPDSIYTDNGKDYLSKSLNGGCPFSITDLLGIDVIHATKYHGQAKPVERFHRTLEEDFGKLFPTYAGKDAKNRPENMRMTTDKLAKSDILPSKEEFIQLLDCFINEYNARISSGYGMNGMSPNQVYADGLKGIRVRKVSDPNVRMLLECQWEKRTVQRNGVLIMNNFYYDNTNYVLREYYKKVVWVGWRSDNIDEVLIFDLNEKFICKAIGRRRPMQGHTTEEEYRQHQKELKHYRDAARNLKPRQVDSVPSILYDDKKTEEQIPIPEQAVELLIPTYSEAAKAFGDTAPAPAPRKRKQSSFADMYDFYEKESEESCQAPSSKKHKLA